MDMTETTVDAVLEIAPDLDRTQLDAGALLREDLELDSMDFLNLMVALQEATGVEVPEEDYGALRTVADIASYLSARSTPTH